MRVEDILSWSLKVVRILQMDIEEEQQSSISDGVLNFRNMNMDKCLVQLVSKRGSDVGGNEAGVQTGARLWRTYYPDSELWALSNQKDGEFGKLKEKSGYHKKPITYHAV